MDEITYRTTIRNESKKGVVLWQRTGAGMGFVAPGKSITLESWNKDAPYSPYEEVIYKNDNVVELKENPLWPKPNSKWHLTALNRDGRAMETRIVCGHELVLLKGIPVTVVTPCDDPWAVYLAMTIQLARVREGVNKEYPEYSSFCWRLQDTFTDRPESELLELDEELKKLLE
jgi:hypothetical protein